VNVATIDRDLTRIAEARPELLFDRAGLPYLISEWPGVGARIAFQNLPEIFERSGVSMRLWKVEQQRRAKLCRRGPTECIGCVGDVGSAVLPDTGVHIHCLSGRIKRIKLGAGRRIRAAHRCKDVTRGVGFEGRLVCFKGYTTIVSLHPVVC
jgi:hypothetical protein